MASEQVNAMIKQMGGNSAFVMMGARDILADETSLQFAVGSNAKRISKVRIVLVNDLYDVSFYRGKRLVTRSRNVTAPC
jgi:hypothetical protein